MENMSITEIHTSAQEERPGDDKRQQNLEETKKIVLEEDPTLPKAEIVKICEISKHRGQRICIRGWVHCLRRQGRNQAFMTIRDGTGYLQCMLRGTLCQTYDAMVLTTESYVALYGKLEVVPEGKTVPSGSKLIVDYWELISLAPPEDADAILDEEALPDVELDNSPVEPECPLAPPGGADAILNEEACPDVQLDNSHVEAVSPITLEELLGDLVVDAVVDVVDRLLATPDGKLIASLNPNLKALKDMKGSKKAVLESLLKQFLAEKLEEKLPCLPSPPPTTIVITTTSPALPGPSHLCLAPPPPVYLPAPLCLPPLPPLPICLPPPFFLPPLPCPILPCLPLLCKPVLPCLPPLFCLPPPLCLPLLCLPAPPAPVFLPPPPCAPAPCAPAPYYPPACAPVPVTYILPPPPLFPFCFLPGLPITVYQYPAEPEPFGINIF